MTFKEFKIHLKYEINKLTEEIEDRYEMYRFFDRNQITFDHDLNRKRFNNVFGYEKITKLREKKQSKEFLLKSIDVPADGEIRARLMLIYINNYLNKSSVKDKENLTYNESKILKELTDVEERNKNKCNKN